MHVAGSGTLKLPPIKSAPLDNSNDYCTLCGDDSQVLHLCDGKECNRVFLKLQMPVSFFFTYHTCVLSIILTYHVSYFARMIHSRMILDIPICMSDEVHVIHLANNCSPALSGLEIGISRQQCVETCAEGANLVGNQSLCVKQHRP